MDSNNIGNIETKEENNNQVIKGSNSYYKQAYRVERFYEAKEFDKYVKSIEKLVRQSEEYEKYIGFLRNVIGLHTCTFLGNVTDEMADIEFHHYPFTLYDIVVTVLDNELMNGKSITSFEIASKVIELHFNHKVGLVPLTKTAHELVHAGKIFINLNQVYGYYTKFIEEYAKAINPALIEGYNSLVEMSFENSVYSENDIFMVDMN